MQIPALSVVVPVLNDAGNVDMMASEIFDVLTGRVRFEVIFVDDGSHDASCQEVERIMLERPNVSLLRHESTRGQSAAVRTGVRAAQAEIVAVIDCEGQIDPRELPKLYGQLVSVPKLRLVIGERCAQPGHWWQRTASRIGSAIRERIVRDGVRDPGCGIKVFYRAEYLELPAFDHMHRFLPALVQRNGGMVWSLPVRCLARGPGLVKARADNRAWAGLSDMLGVMWLQKRRL